jgi:predicted nuclease with TOPRIM domain
MTKQLRTEIERLWKRGEELKDQLIKVQKENARLREALKSIKKVPNSEAAYGIIQVFVDDALKDKSNEHG